MKYYAFKPGIRCYFGIPPKLLWIMNMIVVILTTCLLQVSAITRAQKITLYERNTPLEQVLQKIKVQSGFNVVYASDFLSKSKKVNLQFADLPLETALDRIFKNQSLTYSIQERTIIIKERPTSYLDKIIARFQTIDVRGKILDEQGGPLAGATVSVMGSGKSVKTNAKGEFYLQNVDEMDKLVISYIGYQTREVDVASNMGSLTMVLADAKLEEVMINAGYYTVKDSERTGNIARVTSKDIEKQPISNPLQALYGKVPGLVIRQGSGVQGSGFDIEIRGQNSLRKTITDNGNIPLYVVDGIPFSSASLKTTASGSIYSGVNISTPGASPFNSLNPSDIESIEILKDADATAIYGSRGANGVVLITTKKGKQGAMQIDFNVYTGAGNVTRKMELLNTVQYVEMRKEAFKNSGTAPESYEYDMNGTWSQTDYTDWQEELIGGTSKITDAQFGFSGGSDNSQYRFNSGVHRETTVFPGDFSDWRASGSLNLHNTSSNKKFKSQVTANYSIGKTNLLQNDLTTDAMLLLPNHPALTDQAGNLVWSEDGVNQLSYTKQPYNVKSNNLTANANLEYEFFRGLSVKANMGYTAALRKELSKRPSSSLRPPFDQSQNISEFGNSSSDSWIIEPQLNWQKSFGQHKLNFLAGGTFQSQDMESLNQSAGGFTNESQMDNISAATTVFNTFNSSSYRYNALFYRVNYNYRDTYLLNITGRRDGSSRFGPGKQFANFGAVGASWIFSNNNFLKNNLSILSFGKLRTSYGTTGSDQTLNYGFMDLFQTTNSYQGVPGVEPKQLFNPDYAWEINKKFEAALELGFVKQRVLLTTAFYQNRSSNQLVGYPLPPTTGFSSIQKNLDATVQNTGFEFELSTQNFISGVFRWNSSFNVTFPRNKLLSYPNLAGSSYANKYVIGEPLSIQRTFKSLGVNPETGLNEVVDVDHNGIFNTIDRTENIFIGQKYFGGLSNSFQWKGLQLDILFQFVKQNALTYLSNFGNLPGMGWGNLPVEVMNRWQKPGDIAKSQKFQTTDFKAYGNFMDSDAAIADASYIRLKNLSIAYQVPASWLNHAKIRMLRVYIQGQNLITITKYGGTDPESQGWFLPPLRFLTAGLQLTL